MAKKVIETLVTELTADGAKLRKEMDSSLKNAKSWGSSMSSIAKSVTFGSIAGGAAIVTGLGAITKSAIDNADAMSKQAQIVGVATEEWSAYVYAADMSGVSNEQLEAGFKKLSQTAVEAFRGVGLGAKAFDELGISVKDSEGNLKNNSTLLLELANRFAAVPDGANKTALAMNVFGKSGASLIPMLNGGSEGLRIFKEEAERLNLVIDTDTGKAAEQFNDNITRMGKGLDGIGNMLAEKALPSLVKLTDIIADPATPKAVAHFADGILKLGEEALKAAGNAMPFVKAIYLYKQLIGDVDIDLDWFDKDEIEAKEKALNRLIERAKILYGDDFKSDDRFKFDPLSDEMAKTAMDLERLKKLKDMEANKPAPTGGSTVDAGAGNPKEENPLLKNWELEQQREITFMLEREKRAQDAADKEVAIQRDKFARIHEETLMAQGLDIELEKFRYQQDQEELNADLENLRAHGLLNAELEAEFQIAKEEQEAAHQARLKEIKDKAIADDYVRMDMALGAAENLFGSLSDLTAKFAGKNSKVHRAMFALEKTVSIARSIMAIKTGIALAAAEKYPMNLVAMATVASSTASLVSDINAVGIAHGGLDSVPKEATYLLDKGERVLSPKQNKDLTQFMEKGSGSGANVSVVVNNHSSEPVNVRRGENGIEVIVGQIVDRIKDQVSRGVGIADTFQRTYALQRRGS